MTSGLLLVFDFQEQVTLQAAKKAVGQFANLWALQAAPQLGLKLAVASLSKPAHVAKVQLQVCRAGGQGRLGEPCLLWCRHISKGHAPIARPPQVRAPGPRQCR